MSQRRIVITGIGLVTPLGCGNGPFVFNRLIAGQCGVRKLPESISLSPSCHVTVAASVPTGQGEGEFDETLYKSMERETSKFIRYALHAAHLAMRHAALSEENSLHTHYDPTLCGVAIGNGGIGSLPEIAAASAAEYRRLSPYFVPKILVNMAAGQVSMRYGLKGPCHTVATACAASSHSIGDAFNLMRLGYADLMLAGGSDCSVDPIALSGFARMKALCGPSDKAKNVFTEADLASSRPFDSRRGGFVMGEGAGVLVLEELSSARKRGAPIIAEILGYGLSGDAHHTTSPPLDGEGAFNSMRTALRVAGLSARQIGYFNAHATSTPLGDGIEVEAISRLISQAPPSESDTPRERVFVSSTKGSTGHLLGAAGAVETAFTALALQTNTIPPTLNLQEIDENLVRPQFFQHVPHDALDYATGSAVRVVKREGEERDGPALQYALKNSFGFGGTNASLVLGKYDPSS